MVWVTRSGVTDPRGHVTIFQYDYAGMLEGEDNPMGHFKTYI
jgi:YD repeat-containing protein